MVRLYQATFSRLPGIHCRFRPTCSQYMVDALCAKGLVRGLLLGAYRLLRCNPFCKGGYDPVK